MKDGIYYDISNEDYHNGEGVSKSQLDLIEKCPALYLWNKSAPIDTDKIKSLDFGSAFHCFLLEPIEFNKRFIIAPEINRQTKAGKEQFSELTIQAEENKQTILTHEEFKKLNLMKDSAMALPLAKWMIEADGTCESSIYWTDEETDILCRCRPDKLIPSQKWIIDLKTTADINRFQNSVYDYRYHVQDAFYTDGVQSAFGDRFTFFFLAVSTTIDCGKYPVQIFALDSLAKEIGYTSYKKNLHTLADCKKNDDFSSIQTLSLPYWAKELRNE